MRFWATWWTAASEQEPREAPPVAVANWWGGVASRADGGGRGVPWKMVAAVVDAANKDEATAIIEKTWNVAQWMELDQRPKKWMPLTASFPSVGNERRFW